MSAMGSEGVDVDKHGHGGVDMGTGGTDGVWGAGGVDVGSDSVGMTGVGVGGVVGCVFSECGQHVGTPIWEASA